MNRIEDIGLIPVNFSAVSNIIGEYKAPKDKISKLQDSGIVIRIKKGLFILSPEISKQKLSKELLANHLYGPSYVSLESALAYYGILPERVFSTRSVTTKRKKTYSTPLGRFEFLKVPNNYYPIGIRNEIIDQSFAFLIGKPEKAICDLISTTSHLRLQSKKAMFKYVSEDLRIDLLIEPFRELTIFEKCMETGMKKREIKLLYEILKNG